MYLDVKIEILKNRKACETLIYSSDVHIQIWSLFDKTSVQTVFIVPEDGSEEASKLSKVMLEYLYWNSFLEVTTLIPIYH